MKNNNEDNIDYETIITEYEEKYQLNLPRRMSYRYFYIVVIDATLKKSASKS